MFFCLLGQGKPEKHEAFPDSSCSSWSQLSVTRHLYDDMLDLACERVWRGVDWSELGVAAGGHPRHAGPHGAGEVDSVNTGVDI